MKSKGKIGWSKDISFSKKMVMDESNIVVLNYFDEKPYHLGKSNTVVKYRHGNVSVQCNDKISFSLVFRVMQRYADYNYYNYTMIATIKSDDTKEMIRHHARNKLYKSCDKNHHHALLKQMTKNAKIKTPLLTSKL